MSVAKNKTIPGKLSVTTYISSLSVEEQKIAKELLSIFKTTTSMKPVMWGNMVGFGSYHYKYESGREGDMFATGFAMRKNGPTIYVMPGYEDYSLILKNLGPHKLGKSCLYLKNLNDIDVKVLQKLIKVGLKDLAKQYPVVSS
ncbi:MAG TPA: DUF1801 domain-containing protein [Cryomorphaceae bacterium]|nr:DUF1801 domain-containing protein [Cryomorphaceae bacterium]